MKHSETTCKEAILREFKAAKGATNTRLKGDFFEENTCTNQ